MHEPHEIATIFPLIEGAELQGLSDDIRKQGLLEPIVLYEGKILDGRNRYNACRIAGVKPEYEEFKGTPEEAISRVWSLNFERRHLSSSQRAACDAVRNKMLNSYRAVREAAKERQKATQFAGKDMQGNPKAKSSVSNGTSVSQLIGTPKTETARTSQFRAKAVGTNREYIDWADKLLEQQPEVFKQVQDGKKALTKVMREKAQAADPRKRPRKLPKPDRPQDRVRNRHIGYIDACAKEPQPVSTKRIAAITGMAENNLLRNGLLSHWTFFRWLELVPAPKRSAFTFKIDRSARANSESPVPRKNADTQTLIVALADLRKMIAHDRAEAKARRHDSNWNPTIVHTAELVDLLDRIEAGLDRICQL